MKYVNPELFMNFNNIENDSHVNGYYAWLLLAGSESVMPDPDENSKKMVIRKKSVVGFANAGSEAIKIIESERGKISLTISGGSDVGNILYVIGSQIDAEHTGEFASALALVKTTCLFTSNNSDNVSEFINGGYYGYDFPSNDSSSIATNFVPNYNYGATDNLENIIIIAAYSVTSNTTPINNYNFSGFTVSNSNVEITGLYNENA